MTTHAPLALATANATTSAPASIWGEITPWEIGLLAAGVLFTLALLAAFIWMAVRASRERNV